MAQAKAPPFTLYEYRPSPFCVAVRIALNECEVAFTSREVDIKKPKTAAFFKRSPFGRLPALVEHRPGGELAIFESSAILLFLADRFPNSSLGIPDIVSRGECYSWLSYINTGLADEIWRVILEEKVYSKEEKSIASLKRSTIELEKQLDVLNKHLARRAFLAGNYSVADTLATPMLDLFDYVSVELDAYPSVRAWRTRLRERNSYKGVWVSDE